MTILSEQVSDPIFHRYQVATTVSTFINNSEILTTPADVKNNWKCLHDSFITNDNHNLFAADLLVQNDDSSNSSIDIQNDLVRHGFDS